MKHTWILFSILTGTCFFSLPQTVDAQNMKIVKMGGRLMRSVEDNALGIVTVSALKSYMANTPSNNASTNHPLPAKTVTRSTYICRRDSISQNTTCYMTNMRKQFPTMKKP